MGSNELHLSYHLHLHKQPPDYELDLLRKQIPEERNNGVNKENNGINKENMPVQTDLLLWIYSKLSLREDGLCLQ